MSSISNDVNTWTVLVVDDEPDNIGIPEQVFTFYGAKVHTAQNGQQALDLLQTLTPTFIMADISMPCDDRWRDAAQRLSEEHRLTAHRYRRIGHRRTSSIASSPATRGDGRYLDALR